MLNTGSLPPQLGNLTALQRLDVSKNQLDATIPKELGALKNLQTLILRENMLTGYLPLQLGNLVALRHLNLAGNQLQGFCDHTQDVQEGSQDEGAQDVPGGPVPPQLSRLLDVLYRASRADLNDLRGNPWVEPPASIVGRGLRTDMETVIQYFTDLYADPCRIHRKSIKIIIVGQEGAGKTSLRQSLKANKATPTCEWSEESTVLADVETMEIGGASVRVYDCAGQVAYTGLLQMFLTPRCVCVLVCDAEAFWEADGRIGDQLEKDCRKLEDLRVCDWLRHFSRRVPSNDVILVATKCDLVGGNSAEIGRRMETACRTWLASWVRDGMQPVRLEEGVCLTSCCAPSADEQQEFSAGYHASSRVWACDWRDSSDESPPCSLLHRLSSERDGDGLRGNQITLPRSWDIALTVLEALECGRDPVEMVLRKVANPDGGEAADMASETKTGVYQGITVEDLDSIWKQTVLELETKGITVIHPESALEGAIQIREFDGSLVRHEKFIFLDVVWLARILKPLLNHKDKESFDGFMHLGDTGDTCITLEDPWDIAAWGRLKTEGILEPRLGRAMWPDGLFEYVLPTLYLLGLAFPLEKDPERGLVVLLRLKPERPMRVGKDIDNFCSEHSTAFSASWKIFLGVPPGAIERLLTLCCRIGSVQTFWRYGVLVQGNFGGREGSGLFAMVLEYSSGNNTLTAQVYGDVGTPAPWAALSYAISAARSMLGEFPGMRSRGSLECPEHGNLMPLANEATCGDQLLHESAGCPQCSPETMGKGAAAVELLRVVDIRLDRDVIFDKVKERFVKLEGRYSFFRPERRHKDKAAPIAHVGLAAVKGEVKTGFDEVKAGFHEVNANMKAAFHEVTDGLSEVKDEVKTGFEEVTETLQDVKGALHKVANSTQESLTRLQNLQAPNYGYPRLLEVEEIISGDDSAGTRARMSLPSKQRLVSWWSRLRGVATKDMRLHFLCPVDMDRVPCGFGGEGFRFRKTRDWIRRISPVLQVAVVTAKVALKATAGLDVDVSGFLGAVKSGVFEEMVDRTLDEDALMRVATGEEDPDASMKGEAVASYEALKKFIHKEESRRRDGDDYVDFRKKMRRVDDGKGGMVWVRNENVREWRDSLKNAAPSK